MYKKDVKLLSYIGCLSISICFITEISEKKIKKQNETKHIIAILFVVSKEIYYFCIR